MKYKFLVLVIVAALFAVPASYGSEGKIILSPNTQSAQIYENYTSSIEFNGSSTLVSLLNSSLSNVNESANIKSTSSLYANLSGAIKNNLSTASISNLIFTLNGLKEMSGSSLYYNMSMSFAYNITGIYNTGTWNLSWRSASFHADVGSYLKSAALSAYGASELYVDMNNMSLPLTQWNRTYNATTNVTTFTHSTHFATTNPITVDGLTVSFTFDPTFQIVSPGQATAGTDTISTGVPPAASTPFNGALLTAAIVFVVIVGAGTAALVIARRRK